MAPFQGPQSSHISPSALLDPKSMSAKLTNGTKPALVHKTSGDLSTGGSDARFLLDPRVPKGQGVNSKSEKTPFTNGASGEAETTQNIGEATSVGGYLEKLHQVVSREDRPVKKPKLDQTDDLTANGSKKSAQRSGGDLGEYIKDQQKEGSKASDAIVDLTMVDDSDDLVFLEERNAQEVCYGRIQSAKVHAHALPTPSGKAVFLSKDWPVMKLQLQRMPGKDVLIRVLDPTGNDFGSVDVRTSVGLARIMDSKSPKYRTQAKLLPRKKKDGEYPGKDCSEYFDIAINLYGPRSKAEVIGRWLSQKQIWLRAPLTSDAGIDILNPHQPTEIKRANMNAAGYASRISSAGGPSTTYVSRTVEEIRSEVTDMFDSLQKQSEMLSEAEADSKVRTALLPHQKQALYFMQNRETSNLPVENDDASTSSLWRLQIGGNGRRTYYNIITGQEEKTRPSDILGGILADMMGLGKTLSILSLVVGSLQDAKNFGGQTAAQEDRADNVIVRNSKTTLLVAPLSTINNWEEQIKTHLAPKTLKVYVYHGPNRLKNVDKLAEYDLVITTYSLLSNDFLPRSTTRQAQSPLFETNFYRLVLDEAHMIREQSTKQSQAACAISAERRWAVTGTPVQNRLDDLGALIKFLRVQPFSDKGGFAQYILSPFKNADPEILPKLRLLVDSITLRRLKDRIGLPERQDQIVRLKFSKEEARLYEWFSNDSLRRLRIVAHNPLKGLGGKTYAHILRAIMRLRLICAHGRELLSDDDLKLTEGFSQENAIDLEDDKSSEATALSARQAYEMLMLTQQTNSSMCANCEKKIESDANDDDDQFQEVIAFMLPCYQMICRDCSQGVLETLLQNSFADNMANCPFCKTIVPAAFFELTRTGMEKADEARATARRNPKQARVLGRYGGPHTKVQALIENLHASEAESRFLPNGQPPIKSVVFSGWTTYLDLIQIALDDASIRYVRLDGKMPRKTRNLALDSFRDDPDIRVILISINAGGLGLNLTSASRVFVMEPQFNPAAEAQAVDRVHRLGQDRAVFTYRFIMENSFEEKMLDLQRKKQNLAELSMNKGKLDKSEAAKRKLDDLRSLFR